MEEDVCQKIQIGSHTFFKIDKYLVNVSKVKNISSACSQMRRICKAQQKVHNQYSDILNRMEVGTGVLAPQGLYIISKNESNENCLMRVDSERVLTCTDIHPDSYALCTKWSRGRYLSALSVLCLEKIKLALIESFTLDALIKMLQSSSDAQICFVVDGDAFALVFDVRNIEDVLNKHLTVRVKKLEQLYLANNY
jgi:hypothetical protein